MAALSAADAYRSQPNVDRACQVARQVATGVELECRMEGSQAAIIAIDHRRMGWVDFDMQATARAGAL